MLKIWILYNLIITTLIFGTSLSSARSLTNYLLPLLLLLAQGCLAIRRVAKEDMRRLAKCTGGNIILSLANMEGDEAFDPKDLGHADAIREVRVGDSEMTIFEGTKNYRSGSILLRGANSYMSALPPLPSSL